MFPSARTASVNELAGGFPEAHGEPRRELSNAAEPISFLDFRLLLRLRFLL
jgi:hypothetical protein